MDTFKTKDLFEAAWLHSNNIPFIHLEPENNFFWFVFSNKNQCQDLSSVFWSQNAHGNISFFINSLKMLKDLIFSRRSAY